MRNEGIAPRWILYNVHVRIPNRLPFPVPVLPFKIVAAGDTAISHFSLLISHFNCPSFIFCVSFGGETGKFS